MNRKTQIALLLLLVCVLSVGLIVAGCKCPWCKSKSASMGMQQTTCPVSGKPISKEYSCEYKGKTVFFCCPNCKPAFEKEPEKFVGKLPQFQSSTSPGGTPKAY